MAPVHRGVLGMKRTNSGKVILRSSKEGVSNWTVFAVRCQ
jgi:hypothetical protein